jgi:hypothetical protein
MLPFWVAWLVGDMPFGLQAYTDMFSYLTVQQLAVVLFDMSTRIYSHWLADFRFDVLLYVLPVAQLSQAILKGHRGFYGIGFALKVWGMLHVIFKHTHGASLLPVVLISCMTVIAYAVYSIWYCRNWRIRLIALGTIAMSITITHMFVMSEYGRVSEDKRLSLIATVAFNNSPLTVPLTVGARLGGFSVKFLRQYACRWVMLAFTVSSILLDLAHRSDTAKDYSIFCTRGPSLPARMEEFRRRVAQDNKVASIMPTLLDAVMGTSALCASAFAIVMCTVVPVMDKDNIVRDRSNVWIHVLLLLADGHTSPFPCLMAIVFIASAAWLSVRCTRIAHQNMPWQRMLPCLERMLPCLADTSPKELTGSAEHTSSLTM